MNKFKNILNNNVNDNKTSGEKKEHLKGKRYWELWQLKYLFYLFYLFFFYFHFIYSWLKITHLHKKNLCIASTIITELIGINSVTEQEMQSFPNQVLKSMWTCWHTHTYLYPHSSKHNSRERLYSCAVSFLVFTV